MNKQPFLIIVAICFLSSCTSVNYKITENTPQIAGKHFPGDTWEFIKEPEKLGWSSDKLKIAKKQFREIGSTALMIIDDGIVVAEWGDTTRKVNCHSVRKSFLSALYGIFIDNGTINQQSTLDDLGVEDIDNLSHKEKQATVEDLLKARSGVYHPAAYETTKMKKRRPERGSHSAGTHWLLSLNSVGN